MRIKGLVLFGAALLAGCVTPPREAAHPRKLADHDVGLSGVAVVSRWRRTGGHSFQDPQLDRLIRQGLNDSPTLAQAQARVAAALAQVQSAQAALGPKANLDAEQPLSASAAKLHHPAAARDTHFLDESGRRQLELGLGLLGAPG